jgi:methylenetetrahydrofolate reductase (NADPH)
LNAYGVRLKGTNDQNIKLWGAPKSIKDLSDIFLRYLNGKLERLPWSDSSVTLETSDIQNELLDLNKRGFLTINSQPAVNGVKSTDPVHGWGPRNGFVYQKAYLELFVPPEHVDEILRRIEKNPDLTYYCVNKTGELKARSDEGPNAVTWGIFASKEIIQPTIVESVSFMAWKDEAYQLGDDWAKCHPADSPSRKLLQRVMDEWYILNIGMSDEFNLLDIA